MEFVGIVLILFLILRLVMLRSRLKDLERKIDDLSGRSVSDRQLGELTRRVWALEQGTAVAPPPPPVAPPLPPPPAPTQVIEAPVPETLPERSLAEVLGISGSEEWETLIGGSILNKAGALILVIGIALFLGYSFGHLTPAGRAGIAAAISLLLLGMGVYLERRGRYQIFSRGLTGAGWAALYATAYAIYALPEARIISDPFVGSVVLLAVAAGMVTHSLYYRSQAVTAVAYFAAFAALAATPSGPFAAISLIPLAASLLYLASRSDWYWLPLFGLAATYLTCISHGQSDASLASAQSLFLVYWLLFEGFDLLRVQRRAVGAGLDWLSPLNTLGFLGLSYLSWSSHAAAGRWYASAFAAVLYLADAGIRAYLRPPSSFPEHAPLAERARAGSFEFPLVISAALAGLAIVGRVPGMWAGAALAVEAEILYLTGKQLGLPFVRALGMLAFAFSLFQVFFESIGVSKVSVLGRSIWSWTPAALFHAFLFYVNRAFQRSDAIFSTAAAVLIAFVMACEFPDAWIGTGWVIFGALLFELGFRRAEKDFLNQGYALLLLGCTATFAVNATQPHSAVLAVGVTLAVAYGCALRRHGPLQVGATAATGLLAALLIFRVVPAHRLGMAWMALAILFLLHERLLGFKEFRVAGIGLAALACLATISYNIEPAQLLLSLPVVAGLYAAQYLMKLSELTLEEIAFSIAATLLLCIVLFGRVSGGLLTVAWACEGLALLGIGFPLGQRVLRLQGLVLLLICVLKLFLFDLSNLETIYRILSFVALGVILLGVSWIYTRFQNQIKKLL